MLSALLAGLLAAAPSPLSSEDAAERLAAVEKWAKKQKKPQLSAKDARALEACVELPAVKETGCTTAAKLCRLHEGDDGSSGTRVESLSLHLGGQEHDGKSLRVAWTAIYEAKVEECDPPESMTHVENPEQRAKDVAVYRKTKEYAKCLGRMQKDAKDDAEEMLCDVVLMNACRKEAYVTCRTKNLRKGITALHHLHRFDF
jgi:hypothetical protein